MAVQCGYSGLASIARPIWRVGAPESEYGKTTNTEKTGALHLLVRLLFCVTNYTASNYAGRRGYLSETDHLYNRGIFLTIYRIIVFYAVVDELADITFDHALL